MDNAQKLRDAIQRQNALIVIGTGLTAASVTDQTVCSWPGLLREGVQYLKKNQLASGQVIQNIEMDISLYEEGTEYLLSAAEKVVRHLGGTQAAHFREYISDTIGKLRFDPSKTDLAIAVDKLGTPILTTNYDTVFEDITQRTPLGRDQFPEARINVADWKPGTVFHLHGTWTSPDSLVLTGTDYERLAFDHKLEAFRNSIAYLKNIIFIGCGDGVVDPHFSRLWEWLGTASAGSTHYVLCRSQDISNLNSTLTGRPAIAVEYGDEYAQLTGYIQNLQPANEVQLTGTPEDSQSIEQLANAGRNFLLDEILDSAVIGFQSDGPPADIDGVIIEPVFLPIPPEQFAQEATKDDSMAEDPLDATAEVQKDQYIILTGEEQSGLTTAIMWSALRRTEARSEIPLYFDFTSLPPGKKPLEKAIRKKLRTMGAPLKNSDRIPFGKICLTIDNISVPHTESIEKLIDELVPLEIPFIILGCRPGSELRVNDYLLHQHHILALPAYLGPVGLIHATEIARRVHPTHADRVAKRVLSITRKEKIAPTPLSVTLLIVGVVNNDEWISAVSNTSFVDAFVDSLLGRGGVRDNMYAQIDAAGYSKVLQALARQFIELDRAAMTEGAVVSVLQNLIENLDWSHSAAGVLQQLINKGLLVARNNFVRFRQSAYLHIFAAREAMRDPRLLEKIKERPLYYGPIIRHYAALRRDDVSLLNWALEIVQNADVKELSPDGLFGPISIAEETKHRSRLEEFAEDLSVDDEKNSTDGDEEDAAELELQNSYQIELSVGVDDIISDAGLTPRRLGPYESSDLWMVKDHEPFPTSNLEEAPIENRVSGMIRLVSNILRDSELVEDRKLKENLLRTTLSVWGRYMDIVSTSDEIGVLVTSIVEVISKRIELSSDRKDDIKSNLVDTWSMFDIYSGMKEELATVKLGRALERVIDGSKEASVHSTLSAFMLDLLVSGMRSDVDIKTFILENHSIRAVRSFVAVFVRSTYMNLPRDSDRRKYLEDLLVDFLVVGHNLSTGARGRAMTRYRESLRKEYAKSRALAAQRALPIYTPLEAGTKL